jgi:hypothetical protein
LLIIGLLGDGTGEHIKIMQMLISIKIILTPVVTANKNGKYKIMIQKKTMLAIKHAKLLSKCRPPEKIRMDINMAKQNKNS